MDYGKKDPFRTKTNRNMANKRNMLVSHKGRSRVGKLFTRPCLPVNTNYSAEYFSNSIRCLCYGEARALEVKESHLCDLAMLSP